MTRFVGLDVSQKMTVICDGNDAGPETMAGSVPHGSRTNHRFGPPACGGSRPYRDRDRSDDAMAFFPGDRQAPERCQRRVHGPF